jgi:hypothetical protein
MAPASSQLRRHQASPGSARYPRACRGQGQSPNDRANRDVPASLDGALLRHGLPGGIVLPGTYAMANWVISGSGKRSLATHWRPILPLITLPTYFARCSPLVPLANTFATTLATGKKAYRMSGKCHATGWNVHGRTFSGISKGEDFHESDFVLRGWHSPPVRRVG